ncbi:MAG: 4-(cytidine 5'-diphospho)-2-C-methyl-D-erythritol kinase [Candidatus Zixiibacteriota bacterium]|nr:MAG: 4-(cytidine 5'-diphospho)-2-C-methyl-D-erythritol kinase [candidate division Zixibacteria bacterium]
MDKIELKAPAKINLFLKILGRREDGYHNIYSWFQAVSLYDYIAYRRTAESDFRLRHNGPSSFPSNEKNLIIKTAQLMFQLFDLDGGLDINLKKNIPVSAGLGGGSSDAAATIYAIDKLYDLSLSKGENLEIGLKIGSDIPFFFSSGQAEVTGRGEKIKNIDLPLDYYLILVKPGLNISTADSYSGLKMDLTSLTEGIKLFCYKDFRKMVNVLAEVENDFERGHLKSFPILEEVMRTLRNAGADFVRMSGSGPTIFGLFRNMPEGDDLTQIIRSGWQYYVVRPIVLPAWER